MEVYYQTWKNNHGLRHHYDKSNVFFLSNEIKTYPTQVANETFVVVNKNNHGFLLKVDDSQGLGDDMFQLIQNPSGLSAQPGSAVYGIETFESYISDVSMINGETFVSLGDGKQLKVSGTGGVGPDMFGVEETSTGFIMTGPNFYLGHANFLNAVTSVDFISGELLIATYDKILKVAGIGGYGPNMYGVSETTWNFSPAGAGTSYLGFSKFLNRVTKIEEANGYLFIATGQKVLKTSGTGGNGANMFIVSETSWNFTPNNASSAYEGYGYFQSPVTDVEYINGYTFVATGNKLMKVNGTGGNGANFAAVTETSGGFTSLPNYNYFNGSTYFQNKVDDVAHYAGFTFVVTGNKILKGHGVGGNGNNTFAISENSWGFSGLTGYNWYAGYQRFTDKVGNILNVGGVTYISTGNKLLKIKEVGGIGANFCTVEETENGFEGLPGYEYYQGHQTFDCFSGEGKRSWEGEDNSEITSVDLVVMESELNPLKCYPNPVENQFNMEVNLKASNSEGRLQIVNTIGKIVLSKSINQMNQNVQFDFSSLPQGIYLVTLYENNELVITERIIKK